LPEDEKKAAEKKFKEAAAAYSVLNDEKKRQRYDVGGADFENNQGFDFGGIDPTEIFSMFMGGGMGGMGGGRGGRQQGGNPFGDFGGGGGFPGGMFSQQGPGGSTIKFTFRWSNHW